MTKVSEAYSSSQEGTVLVGAPAGKIIKVLRVLITGWEKMCVGLISDPGGTAEESLLAGLYLSGGAPLELVLGREQGLLVERGKALGFTSTFPEAVGEHSVTVWYETVV